MNLRYIVPALGILITSSGALFAENVGGLTIGGFVDTVGTSTNTDDGTDKNATLGFASSVELRVGYKIGDKVTTQVDLEYNNNGGASGTSHSDVYLEQAYVNYAVTSNFSVTSGKFTTYAGWVSADPDGLYRVNGGPITALYGTELQGVAGNFAPSEDLSVSVFVVDGLYGDEFNGTTNSRLAFAVDALYKVKGVGSFNLEGGYEAPAKDLTIYEAGLNTTLNFDSYKDLTVGAEIIFVSAKDDAANTSDDKTGFLVMGNHKINGAPCPMSGTLMFQMVQDSNDTGPATIKTDTTEVSLALLTQPTGDSHFGVNAEIAYQVVSVDTPPGTDDVTDITLALEAIAIIP